MRQWLGPWQAGPVHGWSRLGPRRRHGSCLQGRRHGRRHLGDPLLSCPVVACRDARVKSPSVGHGHGSLYKETFHWLPMIPEGSMTMPSNRKQKDIKQGFLEDASNNHLHKGILISQRRVSSWSKCILCGTRNVRARLPGVSLHGKLVDSTALLPDPIC